MYFLLRLNVFVFKKDNMHDFNSDEFFYSVDLQWRRYEVVWTSEQSKLSVEVCTGIRINGLQLVPRYSYGNGGMETLQKWERDANGNFSSLIVCTTPALCLLSVFPDTV